MSTETRMAALRTARSIPGWAQASVVVIVLLVVLSTLLALFGLPAVKSGPHHVPIGIVGVPVAAERVRQSLDAAQPGAFNATLYKNEQALRDAVLDRKVYGGFILDLQSTKVLVASAAGPAVAQALTAAGSAIATKLGVTIQTEDLRPLPAADSRGQGTVAASLPLIIGGWLSAIVLVRRFPRRPWLRVGAAIVFCLIAGMVLAVILEYWLGSVEGGVWAVGAGLALGLAALSLLFLGLQSLAGYVGFLLGAILVLPIGSPLSGAPNGPHFLPSGWGAFGQLLPPGANASLLRSTAFFDGAGAAQPALILAAWAAFGLLLCGVAALQRKRTAKA